MCEFEVRLLIIVITLLLCEFSIFVLFLYFLQFNSSKLLFGHSKKYKTVIKCLRVTPATAKKYKMDGMYAKYVQHVCVQFTYIMYEHNPETVCISSHRPLN